MSQHLLALAWRLGRTLSSCVLAFTLGCSASQQIATSATAINQQAELIREQAIQLQAGGEKERSKIIIEAADKIIFEVDDIHASIPRIKDSTPAWLATLQYALYAAIAIAISIILFQTGLGQAIKIAIGWLPQRKIREADLLKNVLEDESPEKIREYIAAKRASDPMLDAAWTSNKK